MRAIALVSPAMIVTDNAIVLMGLPAIHTGLGGSTTGLSWVQNAGAPASANAVSRLTDRRVRERPFPAA